MVVIVLQKGVLSQIRTPQRLTSLAGKEYEPRRIFSPRSHSNYAKVESTRRNGKENENPLKTKVSFRIRLRRPRNDSLGDVGERDAPRCDQVANCAHHTKRLQYGFTVSPHRRTSRPSPPTSEVIAWGRCWEKPTCDLCNSRNSHSPEAISFAQLRRPRPLYTVG